MRYNRESLYIRVANSHLKFQEVIDVWGDYFLQPVVGNSQLKFLIILSYVPPKNRAPFFIVSPLKKNSSASWPK